VLDEGAGDEEPGPRDLAVLDAPLHREAVLERRPQVAYSRDPAHEQLFGGDGHDLVAEPRHVRRVPVLVVRVAQDHQVDVHVHEAGEDAHARGVDHGGAGGHGDFAPRAHGHDALAGDENDAVVEGRPLVAIDHLPADEGEGRLGSSLGGGQERGGGGQQEPSKRGLHGGEG
jgi:hypothetical protein